MKSAIISLSNEGARIAARLTAQWPPCAVFLHTGVTEMPEAARFERIVELTRQIFSLYESLIYVAPTGLVVRAWRRVCNTRPSIRRSLWWTPAAAGLSVC